MAEVRSLPEPADGLGRVETGAVEFGNDWPGLFVRGDDAFGLAMSVTAVEDFVRSLPGEYQRDARIVIYLGQLSRLKQQILSDVMVGVAEPVPRPLTTEPARTPVELEL